MTPILRLLEPDEDDLRLWEATLVVPMTKSFVATGDRPDEALVALCEKMAEYIEEDG